MVGQAANMGRQGDAGLLEKARRAAGVPVAAKASEPERLDIEGEDDRARPSGIVRVVMRLPRIDEHGTVTGQRGKAAVDHELGVRALGLDQQVTMRVSVAHQRRVHVQQSDPPKWAVSNPQRV